MSRRKSREFALQALYDADQAAGQSADQLLTDLLAARVDGDDMDSSGVEPADIEYARQLIAGVLARSEELDAMIDEASTNWRVKRMPLVDRNILRLTAFELIACLDVPHSVAINEAVELAKRFGDVDSKAFVNGILDRIAGVTGRGGRRNKQG
jgi:N utilization substance protein B